MPLTGYACGKKCEWCRGPACLMEQDGSYVCSAHADEGENPVTIVENERVCYQCKQTADLWIVDYKGYASARAAL
jgi:hypothetical protein